MNFEQDIKSSLEVLRSGGIILYPTDTIWGIGCDATNAAAVKKIYELKQRPDEKSMIILLANERDILKYVAAPDVGIFDYLENVKKPTTVIYEGAIGLADNLINRDGSIAIRIVKEEFCKHLVKRLGVPVVSTSANISGNPSPKFYKEIDPAIINAVDYVVNYRRDDEEPKQPSSVVKWEKDGSVTIIRP